MVRERIVQTASSLFAKYGIKSVSMNHIAEVLHISKKTIYIEFYSKEEVLLECFRYEEERIRKIIKKNEEEASNSLEALAMSMSSLYHYNATMCPAFFKDLRRYSVAQDALLVNKAKMHDLLLKYFNRGVVEGYFQSSFMYEPLASLCLELLSSKGNRQQPQVVLTFLRGVCTKKGIEVLNKFTVTDMN
ncbi:TetR/AcrR family transcriptional regulator [Bacteroides sp. 214]|uniref:TetR/AcrR family transcriptional regulator n=1 Tax=Bacteroides sp. 214 TaxID=2302935 RepID=UPI0013D6BF1D|nr:TetR/AcrR family transcriptional regulator [Bacteroides sp. 214]NDW12153.1 TetR/AcrR family transcriptional regulator [Bacteroides sp. 214]